jgi:hypothetical protein
MQCVQYEGKRDVNENATFMKQLSYHIHMHRVQIFRQLFGTKVCHRVHKVPLPGQKNPVNVVLP